MERATAEFSALGETTVFLDYTPIPFIGEKRLARAWKRDSSWGDDSRRLS
jgi:hypothetical protein